MTDDHIRLVLWWPQGQTCRYVTALRSTADYYGWTEEFELWRPKTVKTTALGDWCHVPSREARGRASGGKRLRICRSPSKKGMPAGFTNQFTVSNSCRTIDLAELANFTQGDWHWMEDLSGQRVSKEHWAEIYDKATSRRRGGLVTA
jgi:hypothetical protein